MSAPAPRALASVRILVILLGIFALVLSIVLAREAWIAWTDSPWGSWIQPLADAMASTELPAWGIPLAIVSIAVGGVGVFAALKPRRRTHRALTSSTISAWTRPVDIARVCSATAQRTPGVAAARATVTSKHAHVVVNGDSEDAGLQARVHSAITTALSVLPSPPKVSVTVEAATEEMGEVYSGEEA